MAKLKGNPNIIIPCIDLYDSSPAVIAELVESTPKYTGKEFKRLVENTIGTIHQIPMKFKGDLVRNVDLKNIIVYFGRSSADSKNKRQNLFSRFKHTYISFKEKLSYTLSNKEINIGIKEIHDEMKGEKFQNHFRSCYKTVLKRANDRNFHRKGKIGKFTV
ncbi:hypothetical protein [Candidatus Uabimicrobium sp. HlEnr_7]|uniref:hypothetical protein n=1 Tax=Candidatus Uabimicrobium helgolandensis TaxID=3095367 RepID=UPI003557070A